MTGSFDAGSFDSASFDCGQVTTGGFHATGGWHWKNPRQDAEEELRRQIEKERQELQINKEASQVIAEVAARQAQFVTAQSNADRRQELETALRQADIAWRKRYQVGLTAYRQAYIRVEREVLLRAEMDAEDEELLLL